MPLEDNDVLQMIYLIQVDYSKDFSCEILPLGILACGSALKKAGYEVELIHCTENEIEKKIDKIVNNSPLFVGFSVITGIQTLHSAIMSKEIKKKIDVPIIWGGIHPSLLPEMCLKEDYIDFVVIGEGEETIIELAQKLEGGQPIEEVKGIGYKKNNGEGSTPKINPKRPFIEDLNQYRVNYDLIDMKSHLLEFKKQDKEYKRIVAYKSSRGCPFSCGFCYNLEFNNRKWRAFSKEVVLEDIEFLKSEYDVDGIKFYDDNFYVNKSRALDILNKIGIPAHTEIRIDMIDEGLASDLKKLNHLELLIGIESGSNRILELINKGYTTSEIKNKVKILAKNDLDVVYSTVLGFPTETPEEIRKTIDLMLYIHDNHKGANFTAGVYLPYPGSKLYQLAIKEGFSPPKKTEEWHILDRWEDKIELPWVDAKYAYLVRNYFYYLRLNIEPLNRWLKFRLRHRMFLLPYDVEILRYIENASQKDTILAKIIVKLKRSTEKTG